MLLFQFSWILAVCSTPAWSACDGEEAPCKLSMASFYAGYGLSMTGRGKKGQWRRLQAELGERFEVGLDVLEGRCLVVKVSLDGSGVCWLVWGKFV